MTPYFSEKLEAGLRFQDRVVEACYQAGIPLVSYWSKDYQLKHGETTGGYEIKKDARFAETRNLYIEVAEKSAATNADYVASGIYRPDNAFLWLIGNEEILFFLPKTLLVLMHKSGHYKAVETPTSKGFLLPEVDARKYAAKIITMEGAA